MSGMTFHRDIRVRSSGFLQVLRMSMSGITLILVKVFAGYGDTGCTHVDEGRRRPWSPMVIMDHGEDPSWDTTDLLWSPRDPDLQVIVRTLIGCCVAGVYSGPRRTSD